ncbi:hypothetical protein PAMC26510_11355 [Caballeronia sordidicola]|uniref:Uncharacterized protein n=1 Tax=Caballeronia sordidicola TaxID=196367 RepID=A0A242N1H7_CABSO|nr:hypothetical protein PAMC26510_11355 [Caballeronia sordidicola]
MSIPHSDYIDASDMAEDAAIALITCIKRHATIKAWQNLI